MMVERLREELAEGTGWDEAIERVRSRSIFTTHTPVPAGHDIFSRELVDTVCNGYYATMGVDQDTFMGLGWNPAEDDGRFHMTAAAIRLASHVNGVSKRHGEVSREIWQPMWPGREVTHVPIGSVTNGVHLGSWMSHHVMELLDPIMGEGWETGLPEAELWDRVMELDDADVWRVHMRLKDELLRFCREQARHRWKTLWKEAAHLVGSASPPTSGEPSSSRTRSGWPSSSPTCISRFSWCSPGRRTPPTIWARRSCSGSGRRHGIPSSRVGWPSWRTTISTWPTAWSRAWTCG
jgi:starch phosphorylase